MSEVSGTMSNFWGDLGFIIFLSVYYIIPAYVGNGFAVVTGGGRPIDLGRKFTDKRRILGDGKTIRGFIGGLMVGFSAGLLQLVIANPLNELMQSLIIQYQLGIDATVVERMISPSILRVFLISLGALLGDLLGSFIKRRMDLERGKPAPLLDQLDFVAVALLFGYIVTPLPWAYLVVILVLTPLIHLMANGIAYKSGLKSVPW